MLEEFDLFSAAINLAQIFLQFCIVTALLNSKVRWWITLICSVVIASLNFDNPWIMLGVFFPSAIAYYCFVAKMNIKQTALATAMQLFLSQFVGNTLNIFYYTFTLIDDRIYVRISAIFVYIIIVLIVNRLKVSAINLTREKTILILTLTMMILPLLTIWTEYYYHIEQMTRNVIVINTTWMSAMQIAVLYIAYILNKFAADVENAEYQKQHTESLKESLDDWEGFKHGYKNTVSNLQGYCELNDFEGLTKYIYSIEDIVNTDQNRVTINHILKENMHYIYGTVLSKATFAARNGIRFEIKVTASEFELQTLSELQLSRMVGNLLDNAMEHAQLSTQKSVTMEISNYLKEKIRIVIINSVDEKIDTAKLFRRRWTRKKGHSGFGLYEVKTIVNNRRDDGMYVDFSVDCTNTTFTADLLV